MRSHLLAVNVGDDPMIDPQGDGMHDGKMNPLVVLELSRRNPFEQGHAADRTRTVAGTLRGAVHRPPGDASFNDLPWAESGEVLDQSHFRHLDPR